MRTSRDAPSATASSSEHAHAPSSFDPLVRRTINQLSRQTSDAATAAAATGAATARKHRTSSSSSSFDATTAMPRRKSPEETASQRLAWDSRATSRDGRVGGGARLAANLNSFADAAAMRRDPSPARAAFANKTGDRAAAYAYASGESPGGGGPAAAYVTGRLSPSALNTYSRESSPGSSGRTSPSSSSYPDAYPSPRGFGPKDDRRRDDGSGSALESSKLGATVAAGGWGRGTNETKYSNTLSPGADFSSSPTRSPNDTGRFGRSNAYATGSVTSVTPSGTPKSVPHGVASLAGGSAGAAKENQDAHFHLDSGYEASGYEASAADGAHDFVAGVLDGHGVAGAKVSSFVRSKLASEIKAHSSSAGFSANKNLVNDPRGADACHVSRISAASMVAVLEDAFATAQKALLRAHGADCAESGSTCVVCARRGDNLVVANVGDSRCVLGRVVEGSIPGGGGRDAPFASHHGAPGGSNGHGRGFERNARFGTRTVAPTYVAVDLSVDHKPDRPDEAARVSRAGGVVEPARGLHGHAGPARVWRRFPRAGGLAVSRAFGDSQLSAAGVVATPEIKTERVTPRDAFVVLASDGVWDHVSSDEAVRIVGECVNEEARGGTAVNRGLGGGDGLVWKRAADAVARKAAEGWRRSLGGVYRDDITCVVVPILR